MPRHRPSGLHNANVSLDDDALPFLSPLFLCSVFGNSTNRGLQPLTKL